MDNAGFFQDLAVGRTANLAKTSSLVTRQPTPDSLYMRPSLRFAALVSTVGDDAVTDGGAYVQVPSRV